MTTALRDGSRPAAPLDVRIPAWRVLGLTAAAAAAIVAVSLGCLAVVGYQVSHGRVVHYGNVWLPILALALLWSLHSALGTSPPPTPGVLVDRAQAPGLLDLVDDVAARIGVVPPEQVLLGFHCRARLLQEGDGAVLDVGAPLVWGLTADELRQALLPVLAAAPEHQHRSVRVASAVARRLDHAPLQRSVAGPLLRRLRAACGRAMVQLEARTSAAAADRLDGGSPLDPEPLLEVHNCWDLVVRGFAASAWSRGQRPTAVLAALADARSGAEQVWWTGSRGPLELDVKLLAEPERLDAELSGLLAVEARGGRQGQPMGWPDYLERVVGPARRERAARLLFAVDVVLGSPGPATPARVLDALHDGAGAAVEVLLEQRGADDDVLEQQHLALALQALVSCAAETSGRARLAVSWQTGPILVAPDGRVLPGLRPACDEAAQGRTTALQQLLQELGVPLDAPVWIAGDEPADLGPRPVAALADIWHRGRVYDLVVCEDRLVVLLASGRGLDVRGAAEHFAGDDRRHHDRLERVLASDLDVAVASGEHDWQVLLADIVDVQVRAILGQLMWWTVLRTVDGQRMVLRNGRSPGTVFALRELLAPALGDRLRVRGVDPRFPRLARTAPTWALVCLGLAVALVAGSGYAAAAGQVVPAVVEHRLAPARCAVHYVDPWEPAPVRAEVDCPRDPAAPVDVLALPAPFRGEAIGTSQAGLGLAVATALLLAPAATGIALRTRRSRRDDRSRRAPG